MGLFLWQPVWLFHWRELETGNKIVSRIDVFRMTHGHLPETLKEVRLDDPDLDVYYRKVSDDEYCVWFGTTLGESEIYTSRAKEWEGDGGGCY